MRAQIAYSAILAASVQGSTLMATAQTRSSTASKRFKTNYTMPGPKRPRDL